MRFWVSYSLVNGLTTLQLLESSRSKSGTSLILEIIDIRLWSCSVRYFLRIFSHHPPITACYMWDEEHGIRVGLKYTNTSFTELTLLQG